MKMVSEKTMIVTNSVGISAYFEAGVEREVREDLVELAKEAGAKAVEVEKPAPKRAAAKKTEE